MLDPQVLRRDPDAVAAALRTQGYELDVDKFKSLEEKRRELQEQTQNLQNERNTRSKEIGKAKGRGEDIADLVAEVGNLGERLKEAEAGLGEVQDELQEVYVGVPNLIHESVPVGKSEEDNVEVRRWSEPKELGFEPRDHVDIGEQLKLIDFEAASSLTGSRFVVLKGAMSRLHRALAQFMLDLHVNEHGYTEVYVPFMVNRQSLFGTGQLPKFEDDQYLADAEADYFLIPTAEVPVTNLVADSIVDAEELPLKFACHTPCFRREAGSYGKDTRGILRQHQFEKVELIQIVRPEDSYDALDELTSHAETVLKKLELPFRTVVLCSGDIGFSAAKTFDIEVWVPGQQTFREISSCSNCEDFQARRMQARWRNPDASRPELLHTLNGSGVAVGRAMLAVIENYQQADGSVVIPDALRPYMGGIESIELG